MFERVEVRALRGSLNLFCLDHNSVCTEIVHESTVTSVKFHSTVAT